MLLLSDLFFLKGSLGSPTEVKGRASEVLVHGITLLLASLAKPHSLAELEAGGLVSVS